MADAVVKQHDTYPPLRFKVQDEDGLIPLSAAESIRLILTGPNSIQGTVQPIEPPDVDGFNASFAWSAGQTDLAGLYQGEIEITWDSSSTPPAVETVPNSGSFQLIIESDLG